MRKLKNEKGITLIALVITVAVLSMISIPVVVNMTGMNEFDEYAGFKEDIDILREAISIAYYNKDIGTIGPKYEGNKEFLNETQNGESIKNTNDNNVYYVIDVKKVNKNLSVNMETLKNGEGNKNVSSSETYNGSDDVYIINEQSRTIYYAKGISYKGKKYYRLSENFSVAEMIVTPGVKVEGFNKTYTDKYGNKVKIPVGYKLSENADEQIVSKGLVISDDSENEFVWIPVKDLKLENGKSVSINFDRYTFETQTKDGQDKESESIKIKNDSSSTEYFYEIKNSFEAVSAIENGGFYIGRYEAGTTSERSSSSGTSEQVNVKKGSNLYNYVTKDEAVTLAEEFESNNEKVKSRLCSSYAWDTALKFIEQSENKDYLTEVATGTAITKTGTKVVNNIYDLGYNTYEWTTESSSNSSSACTIRGGVSSSESPITRKSQSNAGANNIGFRIALFLNVE